MPTCQVTPGGQFKSCRAEGGLFHEDIRFKSGTNKTFAKIPLSKIIEVQIKYRSKIKQIFHAPLEWRL